MANSFGKQPFGDAFGQHSVRQQDDELIGYSGVVPAGIPTT